MNPIMAPDRLFLLMTALVLVGAFLAWRTSAKCRLPARVAIVGMRLIGLACLGILAFNPGQWREERENLTREWVVLVDRSLSMSTADVGGKSRWSSACRIAEKGLPLLSDNQSAKIYTFSEDLESQTASVKELAALQPDGKNTDIIQAGISVFNTYRTGRTKLSGIILFSDGRQVVEPHGQLGIMARSQETPIFPIVLGGEVARKDLAVAVGQKQYVTFTGQKTKITALVLNDNMGKINPTVELLDRTGKKIAEQKVESEGNGKTPVQFEITPTERGYHEYRIRIPVWPDEITDVNNEAPVAVAVLSGKVRILLAEGTPFWDSKFITQILRKQTNMEVTSIYRLSADRFFKVETDTSRVSDATEAIFPDDAQSLAKFDVIMFGKGTEYFLTPERIALLKRFLSDQGGCIVFSRGKPYSGTFPELEPMEPASWGEPLDSKFRLSPTQEGESSGLFGDMLPGRDNPVWTKLPLLQYASRCSYMKAFTRVLMEGVCESQGETKPMTFPSVLSKRHGKGIVVAVNAEGLWQWFFFPSVSAAGDMYQEFWTQLLVWAGTCSEFLPGQKFSVQLSENAVFPDTSVRARIYRRISDERNVIPIVRLLHDNTLVQEIPATAAQGEENRWDAVLSVKEPGTYHVELAGTGDAADAGIFATLHIKSPPSEKDNLSADPRFLEKLAEESGGRIVNEDEIAALAKQMAPEMQPVDMNKAIWVPSWNRWWLLCVILFAFAAEWVLRRRNGLV